MLIEHPCRQVPEDYRRRWMSDEDMDLIVWLEPDGRFHGFQLCYDKTGRERALTWVANGGFSHHAVDSGDTNPNGNCTPVLVPDGNMPIELVRREFAQRSLQLDPKIREFVREWLQAYGSH
jgi:hypothetical protein